MVTIISGTSKQQSRPRPGERNRRYLTALSGVAVPLETNEEKGRGKMRLRWHFGVIAFFTMVHFAGSAQAVEYDIATGFKFLGWSKDGQLILRSRKSGDGKTVITACARVPSGCHRLIENGTHSANRCAK